MSNRSYKTYLFIITLSYFAIGFINITGALLALICMITPFLLVYRKRKLTWCQSVCPRADYLNKVGKLAFRKQVPKWLVSAKMKRGVLSFFCINLMFISLSTFMVSKGEMAPIDKVRFLMVFQIPWSLPQSWVIEGSSDVIIHFSYRIYSIMFSSTVIGTILAILYRPRTWCAICPMKTMSTSYLKKLRISN